MFACIQKAGVAIHALLHTIIECAHGPVNTHYTRDMFVMSAHFMSYVHYMCGVAKEDVGNKLLIRFFIWYRIKFLMNGHVHTEYAMIIDSIYAMIWVDKSQYDHVV